MNRGISFFESFFLRNSFREGRVVEVTRVGSMCGLEEFEYCAPGRCRYWNKENYRCEQFVWVSIFFEGKYHTAIVPISKAKEEEKMNLTLSYALRRAS